MGSCLSDKSQYLTDLSIKTDSDFNSAIQDVSETICDKFDSLKPICGQLLISKDNLQLYKAYKVFFNLNFEIINADLQAENDASCDRCRTAVQQKKDQWLNSLV